MSTSTSACVRCAHRGVRSSHEQLRAQVRVPCALTAARDALYRTHASFVPHEVINEEHPFFGIQTHCVPLPFGIEAPMLHIERMLKHARLQDDASLARLGVLSKKKRHNLLVDLVDAVTAFALRIQATARARVPPLAEVGTLVSSTARTAQELQAANAAGVRRWTAKHPDKKQQQNRKRKRESRRGPPSQ